jgi:hypothetical protein
MEEKDVLAHLPGVGAVLYEVEARGEIVKGNDKFAAESMRFKYVIGEATEQKLGLFMCDIAEDVLPIYEAWAPSDDRCRRSIEAGRAYALDPTDEKQAAGAAEAARAAGAARAAWAAGAAEAAWAAEAAGAAWGAARKEALEKYSNWLIVRIESDQ